MTNFKENILVVYSLYIFVTLSLVFALYISGLLELAISLDKSFLVIGIMVYYFYNECYIAKLFYNFNKEKLNFNIIKNLLKDKDYTLSIKNEDVIVTKIDGNHILPKSYLTEHIKVLTSKDSKKLDQRVLMISFSDFIYNKHTYLTHIAVTLGYLGLIGTIIGIIITFWPFMVGVLTLASIEANIGIVFGGIGAAFFPSLASGLICFLLLHIERYFVSETTSYLEDITKFIEIYIIPVVEKQNEQNS